MSAQPSSQPPGLPAAGRDTGSHPAELTVEEPTIGRLVSDASRQLSTLIRSEIALAKSELKVSLTAGGIGAVLLAAAALLLILGVIMASAAFAYALIRWFDIGPDWAFLIVFGVYLLLALILAYLATRRLKKVSAPQRTIDTTKETVATLRRR